SLNRRRLLKEYASLQSSPPPDFFLPTPAPASDDLTTITLHLIGPASTPFEAGLFTVVLKLPPTYPVQPPRATFRTKIFHPNVCDRTGDVCVDTLKREWNEKVTLYEVCVVIRCLLVEPNPTSSLNEEAGRLLAAEYAAWERRARLMTKVHAGIPPELEETVR
ncbi:ubiquitin-conjugating enzyme/RWD-like protein, partial [Kalaharituber pfeilii]